MFGGGYEKYLPEKELPEEIKNLPHEETKCKFCGVSYLVHHEVKRLESQLHRVQSELEEFHNDRVQLMELPSLRSKIKCLNEEADKWRTKHCATRDGLLSSLHMMKVSAQKWRAELDSLNVQINSLIAHQGNMDKNTLAVISKGLDKYREEWKEMVIKRKELKTQLVSVRKKALIDTEQLEMELKKERHTCSRLEESLSTLKQKVETLEHNQRSLEDANDELIKGETSLRTKLEEDNIKWRKELESIRIEHTEKMCSIQKELHDKDKDLSTLKYSYGRLKKQSEETTLSLQNKLDQVQKEYEAKLVQGEMELNKLKRQSDVASERADSMKREMVYSFQKERDELVMNNKLSVEKVTGDMNEKVRKFETNAINKQRLLEKEILNLQEQLSKEQRINEAGIVRHISEEKELAYQLQQARKTLEVRNSEYAHVCEKMKTLEVENDDVKRQFGDTSLLNEALESKLEKAYSEISSLQKTVEQQCLERSELMSKVPHKKTTF